jgi:ABC-type dipeptide/oligopeptide/nickel transport system ATPase subunit
MRKLSAGSLFPPLKRLKAEKFIVSSRREGQMSSPSNLLLIRNLSNYYINRKYGFLGKKEIKPVLNNINMDIKNGEIFGLTGKSGCGKTTLAHCILGLIDYSGDIFIEGEKHEISRRKVQMVFQEPGSSLNPCKKIGWLMEEPLVIHKTGNGEEREKMIDQMLLRVGLDPSYKSRRVNELSGGQKQRLCIGRSLILEPSLLIADEAISSLDVSAGAQILNLFKELNKHLGLGILFISHNREAVEYLCDRVAHMNDGVIVG